MEGYQAQLNQVGWSLGSISIVVVACRCYCRLIVLKRFGWDDAFMVLALFSGVTCAALVSAGVHYGYGMHLADIGTEYEREQALKYTFIAPAVSIVSSTTGKISMVFFLVRLLGSSARKMHLWFLFSVTFVMIGLNVFAIGILLGNCQPMEKSWKPLTPGKCLPLGYLDYGGRIQAVWNAIMDLVTAGFPVYMVWSLQMKKSTKWGLTVLMGGSVFAAAATLVKVYYMRDLTKLTDVTYSWGPISIWAEIFVLIIAGTIPTLKPLWSSIRGQTPSAGSDVAGSKHKKRPSDYPYGSSSGRPTKGSKGYGSRGPGSVTIALNEIDDITQQAAGSSSESILPRHHNDAKDRSVRSERSADSIKDTSSQYHALSAPTATAQSPSIRVEKNFSVSYDQRMGPEPVAGKHHRSP
ncbi:hypothetical protein BDV95DRAFT_594739 [Massariosphaeria phaeospora]|uniref:Rhodopsin domain-containing protein n=1 Tax=Massariosphaeria phaeospora TaxID=100035 RepID=A0A7C8I602_9PLEO|nr:hypothetical protein BDV95DRAFT_594739 [Massariosphaeria phaeospora]